MSQKIFIHGVSSSIGRNFIPAILKSDAEILIFARRSSNLGFLDNYRSNNLIKIVLYDYSLNELFSKRNKNENSGGVFFDFAWFGVSGRNRNLTEQLTVNIPLVINSVELANLCGAGHWVGFGSQAEYGIKNRRVDEKELCEPTTVYGKSKLLCSQIAKELCYQHEMKFTWLRLFSLYGPGSNQEWLIPFLIAEMLKNNPVNVTLGEQMWDYLFVDDIVNCLIKLIRSKGLGIVNLASGEAVRIKDIVRMIKSLTQSESVINYGAIPYPAGQTMYLCGNIDKLTQLLDWKPEISLEEGLRKTIEAIKNGH